jgi:hypothetical protein
MPLEIEGGPTDEYLQANSDRVALMAELLQALHDREQAEKLWQADKRDQALAILQKNPNVGIEYRALAGGEVVESGSYFGKDAADFLRGLLSPQSSASAYVALVGGDSLAGVGQAPQDISQMDLTQAERLLTNECVHFLNSILAELGAIRNPHNYNFAGIFRTAKNRGVFRSVRLSDEELKKRLGGTNSIISDRSLIIEVDERHFNRSDLAAEYILIHEIFHASPASGRPYNHFEMARAAYKVAAAQGLSKKLGNTNTPGVPQAGDDEKSDWYNAGLFDNVVRLGCPIPN